MVVAATEASGQTRLIAAFDSTYLRLFRQFKKRITSRNHPFQVEGAVSACMMGSIATTY
ncbi:hypothetical protein RER_25050 [Rhodococcus erythropolis PR4]|uniref:Uncharacterized protein n=1 Tax=Rhodococcus erythropolis (strain PR4 / NBRC 100887) TaxID=234621 RepID=C0ZXX8_RHOE4|nr:hypothetical protein RER_25050 [Rhodococcus erythropolis PR4]